MQVRYYDEKGRCWAVLKIVADVDHAALLELVRQKVCKLGYAFATISDVDGMEIVVTETG